MQAALLMNKLKSGGNTADTSTLLAAASALGASKHESNVLFSMYNMNKIKRIILGRPRPKVSVFPPFLFAQAT